MFSCVESHFRVAEVKVFKSFGQLWDTWHEEIWDPLTAFEVKIDEVFQIFNFIFSMNVAKLTPSENKSLELGQIPNKLPFELSRSNFNEIKFSQRLEIVILDEFEALISQSRRFIYFSYKIYILQGCEVWLCVYRSKSRNPCHLGSDEWMLKNLM